MKITSVDVILMDMHPADNPGWAPVLCRVYTDAGTARPRLPTATRTGPHSA